VLGLALFYVGAVLCLNGRPMDVPLCTPGVCGFERAHKCAVSNCPAETFFGM
jgi:hypothetical protein